MWIDIFSWICTIVVVLAFTPQAIKLFRTRKVEALSIWPWIIDLIGCYFWILFGSTHDTAALPIIISNFLIALLVIATLYFILITKIGTRYTVIFSLLSIFLNIVITIISIISSPKYELIKFVPSGIISIIIGILAGCLTSFAFLPQAILTLKTMKTQNISLYLVLILNLSNILWFIFYLLLKVIEHSKIEEYLSGIITLSFAIIIATSLCFAKIYNMIKHKEKPH